MDLFRKHGLDQVRLEIRRTGLPLMRQYTVTTTGFEETKKFKELIEAEAPRMLVWGVTEASATYGAGGNLEASGFTPKGERRVEAVLKAVLDAKMRTHEKVTAREHTKHAAIDMAERLIRENKTLADYRLRAVCPVCYSNPGLAAGIGRIAGLLNLNSHAILLNHDLVIEDTGDGLPTVLVPSCPCGINAGYEQEFNDETLKMFPGLVDAAITDLLPQLEAQIGAMEAEVPTRRAQLAAWLERLAPKKPAQ